LSFLKLLTNIHW